MKVGSRSGHGAVEGKRVRKAGVDYASMDRNDPATIEEADTIQVNVRGVPATKTGGLPADRGG